MSDAAFSNLVCHLGQNGPPNLRSATDADVLARFVATRDEEAFAELVRRHGGLVFGVCRRVTRNHHLSEDAFQAVFVVLAAKAATVRPPSVVGPWLYAVAWRTAMRARTMANRRQRRETLVSVPPEAGSFSPHEPPDAVILLDEEIARLPEHYRTPVVLCEIQGKSRKEAANLLKISEGTLSGRLATARKRLAERLRQRGVALSTVALSMAIAETADSHPPMALVTRAAQAATRGAVSASVSTLSQGVLRMIFLDKLKKMSPIALLVAGLLTCATVAAIAVEPAQIPGPVYVPQQNNLPPKATAPLPTEKADSQPHPKGLNKLVLFNSREVSLVDPDGKNEMKISDQLKGFPSDKAIGEMAVGLDKLWLSPDGKRLAAVLFRKRKGPFTYMSWPGTLFVADVAGDAQWIDFKHSCLTAAWSPDGDRLATTDWDTNAFARLKPRETTSYVINVKTKEKEKLNLPNNHIITDWARDGKHLLTYSTGVKDNQPSWETTRLHLMNLDGTEFKALGDKELNLRAGRISPNGTRVLCNRLTEGIDKPRPGEIELLLLDIATGKTTRIGNTMNEGALRGLCWSPDGKQIAHGYGVWKANKDSLGSWVESAFVVICDADGKNSRTREVGKIQVGKGELFWGMDWR